MSEGTEAVTFGKIMERLDLLVTVHTETYATEFGLNPEDTEEFTATLAEMVGNDITEWSINADGGGPIAQVGGTVGAAVPPWRAAVQGTVGEFTEVFVRLEVTVDPQKFFLFYGRTVGDAAGPFIMAGLLATDLMRTCRGTVTATSVP